MGDMLPVCVEYATSGKSKCGWCKTLIDYQSLRIGQRMQSRFHDNIYNKWFHWHCFFDSPTTPKPKSRADFDKFDIIRWEDQQKIIKSIGQLNSDCKENIRERVDDEMMDAEPSRKKMRNDFEESEIEKQNKMIYAVRDQLKEMQPSTFQSLFKIVSGCDNKRLLRQTDANVYSVADAMVFGLLERCKKCSGRFEYVSGRGYACTGNFSEWTKCEEVTQHPARIEFPVPMNLRDSSPFLQSYEAKVRKRIVPVTPSSTSSSNFAPNCNVSSPLPTPMTNSLKKTVPEQSQERRRFSSLCVTKSGVVDPESNLTGVAHVYERDGVSFTAILVRTSIQTNKNSYYILQILEHDQIEKYYLFRRWGRIGTKIGEKKIEELALDICIKEFEKCYFEKTGNRWIDRQTFVKHVDKYCPVDTDHGENICRMADATNNLESKLELSVQYLIELIFNTNTMETIMMEYELDLKKMPLGNLSMDQLLAAYTDLKTLSKEMETTVPDDNHALKLKDATNKFYNRIPHDFGLANPPPFKTLEDIKAKCNMISDLLCIQMTFALLHCDINLNIIKLKNPVDVNYGRLNACITPLKRKSKRYNIIEQYVAASKYDNEDFGIDDIFVVERAGEEEGYEIFKNLPNRTLLWHGSRDVNIPGILSQGLRIAPPEAPEARYMFGKGIYFADRLGKSAKYCGAKKENPIGVLLLCEVALGNMYELKEAQNIKQLPEGKNSTMGLGFVRPDPTKSHIMRDGVKVPCGPLITMNDRGPFKLIFNKYVVYNPSQIRIRYVLIVRFNHLL